MATETPNIGLQIPDFNQANWQVPTNFNWNLLDLIFGGGFTVPALDVTNLTVGNASSFISTAIIAAAIASEQPAATVPGTTYTMSLPCVAVLVLAVNGLVQTQGVDFTVAGSIITFSPSIDTSANVLSVYLHS